MARGDYLIKPPPPKKALSAFFLYRGEVFEKVKSENPHLKVTELTKLISEMWANADEETKARLNAKFEENKKIADKERQ